MANRFQSKDKLIILFVAFREGRKKKQKQNKCALNSPLSKGCEKVEKSKNERERIAPSCRATFTFYVYRSASVAAAAAGREEEEEDEEDENFPTVEAH